MDNKLANGDLFLYDINTTPGDDDWYVVINCMTDEIFFDFTGLNEDSLTIMPKLRNYVWKDKNPETKLKCKIYMFTEDMTNEEEITPKEAADYLGITTSELSRLMLKARRLAFTALDDSVKDDVRSGILR